MISTVLGIAGFGILSFIVGYFTYPLLKTMNDKEDEEIKKLEKEIKKLEEMMEKKKHS